MIIYFNDPADRTLDIQADDDSYRYRAIKGDHNLTLHFSLPEHVEIPIGAYCVFQNETYTLEKPESLKMQHSRNFEYTVIFDSPQAKAGKWKFRNPADRRLKFSLTATPREHLQMLVDNMNQRDSGWTIGRCIEGPEKVISYNHAYCIDALAQIADECETEYEFVGKQVSLWKVEYNRDNPLPLSYGKGNGFKPGIGRSNFEDSTPIEILYVQGGAQNLDPSRYGNPELLLPKNREIRFDGVHFEDEDGFDASKARIYKTDADGFSIRRADKPLLSQAEDSLDCSEIYPKRIGTISRVMEVDTAKHFYDIIDDSIPEALNFRDYRIAGETMTIIFQSGELAGREFEIEQNDKSVSGYIHSERRFKLVPQEIDGMTMPGGGFVPKVGDTYAVFHCMLPAAYICDDATKTGASWDMFREGVKCLYDNEEQKFSFTGELDGAWAKRDWNNIGGRIRLGGFVRFSDERFQPEGVLVRIIGIKDYINNPHSPEIELSNSTVGRTVASDLRKIESNEVVVEDKHREALQFTKRRYRDSMETIEMLGDALLDNFTNSINPVAVQTMAMLVGDKSLQFEFVDNTTTPTPVAHNVVYNQASKVLTVPAGIIQHMTLGIDTISSSHAASEYKFWSLAAFQTPVLTDGEKKYYLYAKVSKTTRRGVFYISETAIGLEAVAGHYHLLMGVLNSEYEGERSYVSLHGYTEVLPGQVMTNKVVSSNGQNFLDFLNNSFRIGNSAAYLDWNASIANVLSMKNATIQMANNAGETMVYISGVNGSGQLAKGNITWDAAGNLKAKGGTFTNVIIDGAIRTPFRDGFFSLGDGLSTYGLHDNNCIVIPGESGMGETFSIPFTSKYNGFRATILNAKWGNKNAIGPIGASAPSGFYFHEDGEMLKELVMNANEGVEIIGVGEGSTFKGWAVLNRFRFGIDRSSEGFPLKALFAGKVEFLNGVPKLVKQYRYNRNIDRAGWFICTLSYPSKSPYYCTIRFPDGTFSSADNYTVLLTGERLRTGPGAGAYASVIERTASYFTVYTGDDDSWNDSNFTFVVLATHLWENR